MVGYGAQLEKLRQHFRKQNIILETPAILANVKGQSLFMMQLKNLVKILIKCGIFFQCDSIWGITENWEPF